MNPSGYAFVPSCIASDYILFIPDRTHSLYTTHCFGFCISITVHIRFTLDKIENIVLFYPCPSLYCGFQPCIFCVLWILLFSRVFH
jgi:hypothetical protein